MPVLRSRMTVFACILLLPLAACAPADETAETDATPATELEAPAAQRPAELQSAIDAYTTAWNGSDVAAVSAFFMEDATVKRGEETFTGRPTIEAGWLTETVPGITDLVITEESSEQRGADWHSAGRYTHSAVPGDTVGSTSGRYSVTWGQAPDGQWRIRASEIVPDAPPAAATQN